MLYISRYTFVILCYIILIVFKKLLIDKVYYSRLMPLGTLALVTYLT